MENKASEKASLLEEELLLVANSGEIPEVALHSSLYFLTGDPEGPGLSLTDDDVAPLCQAVFDRYLKIMRRDLNPALRDKRIYRGLARFCCNWRRFATFCGRRGFDHEGVRGEMAGLLVIFLRRELSDLAAGLRDSSSVNCASDDLFATACELGLLPDDLPDGWRSLCLTAPR